MSLVHQASLINPGAETGTTTGWVTDRGGNVSVQTVNAAPHSGNFTFVLANSAFGDYYQDYVLPANVRTLAWQGALIFNPSVYQTDFSSPDNDKQRFRVSVFNANSEVVQHWHHEFVSSYDLTWVVQSIALPLHNDAVAVRLRTDGLRSSGTELSAYQDDYSLAFLSATLFRFPINIINPSGYSGTDSWDVTCGNFASNASSAFGVPYANPASFYFDSGSAPASVVQQIVTLPNTFSLYSAIDMGSLSLSVNYMQGTIADSDQGQMVATFINTDGSNLSATSNAFLAATRHWIVRSLQEIIPPGTRQIKFEQRRLRFGGNNIDARFTAIQAYILTQSNFVDGMNDLFPSSALAAVRRAFPIDNSRDFPDPVNIIRDIPVV